MGLVKKLVDGVNKGLQSPPFRSLAEQELSKTTAYRLLFAAAVVCIGLVFFFAGCRAIRHRTEYASGQMVLAWGSCVVGSLLALLAVVYAFGILCGCGS